METSDLSFPPLASPPGAHTSPAWGQLAALVSPPPCPFLTLHRPLLTSGTSALAGRAPPPRLPGCGVAQTGAHRPSLRLTSSPNPPTLCVCYHLSQSPWLCAGNRAPDLPAPPVGPPHPSGASAPALTPTPLCLSHGTRRDGLHPMTTLAGWAHRCLRPHPLPPCSALHTAEGVSPKRGVGDTSMLHVPRWSALGVNTQPLGVARSP